MHGPIEVLIGLSFGIFWGLLAQWLPDKDHPHVSFFRWLIVFAGGLIALYGAHLIHYDGAGGRSQSDNEDFFRKESTL